jgi:hypothetical protein
MTYREQPDHNPTTQHPTQNHNQTPNIPLRIKTNSTTQHPTPHGVSYLVRAAFLPGIILFAPDLNVADAEDALEPRELDEEIPPVNCAGAVDFAVLAFCAPSACQTLLVLDMIQMTKMSASAVHAPEAMWWL